MAKLRLALGLLPLLGLLGFTLPVAASPDTVKWSRVNIPTEGAGGNWALAYGSDVQHLTMSSDGTLYAYGKGLSYTLYKSTDNGYSWSYLGKINDAIVDIATAADDSNTLYYATKSHIYRSTNGGETFVQLPNPGGAGSNNVEITSIDIAYLGYRAIIAGTRDTDSSEYGGVYILDDSNLFTWMDTSLGNYDVYAVAFSQSYAGDRQLIAVVSDETNTFIATKVGSGGWGSSKINNVVPVSAAIVFPQDYGSSIIARYFVALNSGSGKGDVYKVENSVATDLNIGSAYNLSDVDVTGLAISGNNLMAGAAASAQVYFSTDGGKNWERSTKPLTGQSTTYVVMASDFADSGVAYATTSGAESAFSVSRDGGISWNQLSLIDTRISRIVDLAPSLRYSQDNTLFMLTNHTGGKDSLWCSLNGGTSWERVYTSALASVDAIDRVALPPQYGSDNKVVFIAGTSNSNPAIWKSTDNGQNFICRIVTFPIDTWTVVDNNTLFIGSHDGSNGLVYRTTDSGISYSEGGVAGSQSLNSIALSPKYDEDKTLLVGNKDGWVYWSEDSGDSFKPLPPDATAKSLSGMLTVAFDPEYSTNKTIYAASNTADKGIYRFITGKSDKWEKIDSPTGGIIGQILVSAEGTLYANNFKADGGMERCLNPTYPLGPTFETVTKGLDDGAKLIGLWLCDNRLWSIDSAHTRLMTYSDSLTQSVTLTSPPDQAPSVGLIVNNTVKNISLDWETLEGANEYEWQLNYDTDFSSVPADFEGNTQASSAQLPALDPATTYYWRVRASEPVLSPWSDKWSFTTALGTEAFAPELDSPEAGATGVSVKPIFQWSAIAGATSYELVVSAEATFNNPTILKDGAYALPTNAWQSNIALNYNTTYYWKVRAISATTTSPWSAASAFTTEPPPSPQPTPPPQSAPPTTQPATPDWIEWLMPLGGVLLLVFLLIMLAMLITLIILVIKIIKL